MANLNKKLLAVALDSIDQATGGSPFHTIESALRDVQRANMFGIELVNDTGQDYVGLFIDDVEYTFKTLNETCDRALRYATGFTVLICHFNLLIRKWEVIEIIR